MKLLHAIEPQDYKIHPACIVKVIDRYYQRHLNQNILVKSFDG